MTATPTSETTFDVQGQSLTCFGFRCGYVGKLGVQRLGQPCPLCGRPLEHSVYQVDLADNDGAGKCGCPWFEKRLQSQHDRLTPPERAEAPVRCKHIKFVRAQWCLWRGQTEEQLDAWLAGLPDQTQTT